MNCRFVLKIGRISDSPGAVLLRHPGMVGAAGKDTHRVHELGLFGPVGHYRWEVDGNGGSC